MKDVQWEKVRSMWSALALGFLFLLIVMGGKMSVTDVVMAKETRTMPGIFCNDSEAASDLARAFRRGTKYGTAAYIALRKKMRDAMLAGKQSHILCTRHNTAWAPRKTSVILGPTAVKGIYGPRLFIGAGWFKPTSVVVNIPTSFFFEYMGGH